MLQAIKTYKILVLLALAITTLYAGFAYDLVRSDFIKLITLYAALFFLSYKILQISKGGFWVLAGLGIFFRLVFIAAIPNLSQDFYRFLWDGRLLLEGFNPYLSTPIDLSTALEGTSSALEGTSFSTTLSGAEVRTLSGAEVLIHGMGTLSANNFTSYPPVNQLFFAIAAFFGGKSILGSVIVLRLIIILADLGILYFGKKILVHLNLPAHNIFWFFLNPFIIIELTGNLHFEGVMLFFFIAGMYFLLKGKWIWAAVLIGISVSVKLLPLLFLPLLAPFALWHFPQRGKEYIGLVKLVLFYSIVLGVVCLTFLPFYEPGFITNFSTTIALWFQNFEFNASIYYLIRWVGFQTVGYNIIGTVGKILPIIVLVFIILLSFLSLSAEKEGKNRTPQPLITAMLFGVCFYFLLATTVHPWYLATPLLLSVFTKYKFPMVWSLMVVLSYSAYGENGFSENLWLVALEYLVVGGFFVWETIRKPKVVFGEG